MDFTGTKRIEGRLAASQIASASMASFPAFAGTSLAPLHVRLDISRRNKTHLMAGLGDLARPVMRRAAGLHRHHARGKPGEGPQNLTPLELLA